jgi:hypothetical protein
LKFKEKGGFKATDKKAGTPAATSALAALGGMLMATVHSVSHFSMTMGHRVNAMRVSDRQALAAAAAAAAGGDGAAAAAAATDDSTPYVTASSALSDSQSVTNNAREQDELGQRAKQRGAVRGTAGLSMPIAEAVEEPDEALQLGDVVAVAATASAVAAGSNAVDHISAAASDTLAAASARANDGTPAADNKRAQQHQASTAQHANASCWPFGCSANHNPSTKTSQKQPKKDSKRRCDWLRTNIEGLGWRLDPWVLLFSLGISVVAVAAGAWQIEQQRERFDLRSATSATQVRLQALRPGWCVR